MTGKFNWVKARAECSLSRVFEELKAEVRDDVEMREQLLEGSPQRSQCGFHFNSKDRSFTVVLEGHKLHKVVEFTLDNKGISARSDGKTIWTATVGLNDDGHCILRIQGAEYEHWQARKMALEQLFFSDVPAPDFFARFGGHPA